MRTLSKLFAVVLLSLTLIGGCATLKPVLRSVDQIAQAMCAAFFSDKQGVSVEDAARIYCATREAWEPWVGPALEAQKAGGAKAEASSSCPMPAPKSKDAGAQ